MDTPQLEEQHKIFDELLDSLTYEIKRAEFRLVDRFRLAHMYRQKFEKERLKTVVLESEVFNLKRVNRNFRSAYKHADQQFTVLKAQYLECNNKYDQMASVAEAQLGELKKLHARLKGMRTGKPQAASARVSQATKKAATTTTSSGATIMPSGPTATKKKRETTAVGKRKTSVVPVADYKLPKHSTIHKEQRKYGAHLCTNRDYTLQGSKFPRVGPQVVIVKQFTRARTRILNQEHNIKPSSSCCNSE